MIQRSESAPGHAVFGCRAKDTAATGNEARKTISATVERTETRIEQAAPSAKKSAQRTIDTVEKKAKDVKVQAERTLARAAKTSSRRVEGAVKKAAAGK